MKKWFIWMIMAIFCLGFVYAETPCNTSSGNASATLTNVIYNTATSIVDMSRDAAFSSIISMNPTNGFNRTNLRENKTLVNASTIRLNWSNSTSTAVIVANASDQSQILKPGNYTVNAQAGTITWNLDAEGATFDTKVVQITYNKSFEVSNNFSTANYTWSWSTTNAGVYDAIAYLTLTPLELNNTNWTIKYSYTVRTCSVRDSCNSTQMVIFAGMSLIALFAIVLAAFGIIQIVSGNSDTTALMMTLTGLIGLAIVLYAGYYIVGAVGVSVC